MMEIWKKELAFNVQENVNVEVSAVMCISTQAAPNPAPYHLDSHFSNKGAHELKDEKKERKVQNLYVEECRFLRVQWSGHRVQM